MNLIFGRKHSKSLRNSFRASSALLGTGALLALAGCGGGGSNNNNGNSNNANASLFSANLVALASNNQLISFNSRTPSISTTTTVTGLNSGDALRAIDYRYDFGITGNGQTGLYAIGQFGSSQQLYLLTISGTTATATKVGARFNLIVSDPAATAFGFDFNPTVDRIRLVEPTANRNLRLNPNAGTSASPIVDGNPTTAGVQGDGTIAYAAGDANFGQNPDAAGAAYSNPDADTTTGTTLYVLDSSLSTLTTQGRAADSSGAGAVSPNTGQLFTIAKLNIDLGNDVGFDIAPGGNAGFLSNGNRIYGLVVEGAGAGTLSGGARVMTPANNRILGLAVTP